jgi:hypothetical protein
VSAVARVRRLLAPLPWPGGMTSIRLDADLSGVRNADLWLAKATDQLPFVTSVALTNAAKSIHANLKAKLPNAVNKPTRWTERGLIVKYSTKRSLFAAVGFNYGEGLLEDGSFTPKTTGVPSGRYMDVLARGGIRQAKSTERALRRVGVINSSQFLTPSGLGIGRLNKYGNASAGAYSILRSSLQANRDQGVTSNARNPSERLFVDRRNGITIMERKGRGPKGGTGKGSGRPGRPQTIGYKRGIRPAFHVVSQPRYRAQFPVQKIALAQLRSEYAQHFRAALEQALRSRR